MSDGAQERKRLDGWLVRPILSDDLRIQLRASAGDLPEEARRALEGGGELTDAECPSMASCGEKNGDCPELRWCGKFDESKR